MSRKTGDPRLDRQLSDPAVRKAYRAHLRQLAERTAMQIAAVYTGTEFRIHKSRCPDIPSVGDPDCKEVLILSPASRKEAVRRVWADSLAAPAKFEGGQLVVYPERTIFLPCCAALP